MTLRALPIHESHGGRQYWLPDVAVRATRGIAIDELQLHARLFDVGFALGDRGEAVPDWFKGGEFGPTETESLRRMALERGHRDGCSERHMRETGVPF